MVFCESKIFRLKTANDRIVKYGSTKIANLLADLEVAHKIANQKTVKNTRLWEDFSLSGASFGGSVATWNPLVAALEPLGSMLEAILETIRLSYAILEAIFAYLDPSWSHLGPSRTP